MKCKKRGLFLAGAALLVGFVLWTAAVCFADVQAIGPGGTAVGFGTLNGAFHRLTGVHMELYVLTDWLGLIPVVTALGFGLLGLIQWIRRGSIRKVDRSLPVLGGYYAAVLGAYLLFEILPVNYRPVLIEGRLEASYPSSTTLLVLTVMPAAMLQLRTRLRCRRSCRWVNGSLAVFTGFMLLARTVSGVHWLSDILGGILLSGSLLLFYAAFNSSE